MHSGSQLNKAEASTFFWRVCWATCSSKSNLNTHLCAAKRSHAIQKHFKTSKNIWNTQQGTTQLLFLLHLFTATFHLGFGGTWGGNRRKTSAFEWLFMAGIQRLPDGCKFHSQNATQNKSSASADTWKWWQHDVRRRAAYGRRVRWGKQEWVDA